MTTQVFNGTGNDGNRYTVYRIQPARPTQQSASEPGSAKELDKWVLAESGDTLEPTLDGKTLRHSGTVLKITLD